MNSIRAIHTMKGTFLTVTMANFTPDDRDNRRTTTAFVYVIEKISIPRWLFNLPLRLSGCVVLDRTKKVVNEEICAHSCEDSIFV